MRLLIKVPAPLHGAHVLQACRAGEFALRVLWQDLCKKASSEKTQVNVHQEAALSGQLVQ